MDASQIVRELRSLGSESTAKVLRKHGARDPVLGVKIGDMKKFTQRVKTDYQLALDLYDTGIYDAMYLAGLIADDAKMTRKDLNHWAKVADGGSLCGYTVAWVATGSPHGPALAVEWVDSKKENIAIAGWSTLACLVSSKADDELDIPQLKRLLQRVEKTIHDAPNKVRYVMNTFVIALGTYVRPLAEQALRTAEKIGRVTVDMGDTACQVPYAPDYIKKSRKGAAVAAKRKTVKC